MEIYVNDCKIDYQPVFPLTWGGLFQKLLRDDHYIDKDHGIVRIAADDVDLPQGIVERADEKVPEDIKTLRFFTRDSLSVTREDFKKAAGIIEDIKTDIADAANFYKKGAIKEAAAKIAKIMEAIKPMLFFIHSVGINFSLNFDEILFDPQTSLSEKIEAFSNTLQNLVTAQMKKKYLETADYLENQLMADMDDWNKMVDILDKEIENRTNAG